MTRPGGEITDGNRTVRAVDDRFPPLLPNQRYLLFLKYLNATQTFATLEPENVFQLSGGIATNLVSVCATEDMHQKAIPVERLLAAIANAPCR